MEAGDVRFKIEKNSPLSEFGDKAVVMIDNQTCKTRLIVIPTGDKEGTHFTFFKKDGKWYYHPPGDPNTHIPCTDAQAKQLESMSKEAEKEYSERNSECSGGNPPIPPPPPIPPKSDEEKI